MGVTKEGYRMKLPESKQPSLTPSPHKEHFYKPFCAFNNLILNLEAPQNTEGHLSAPSLGSSYLY